MTEQRKFTEAAGAMYRERVNIGQDSWQLGAAFLLLQLLIAVLKNTVLKLLEPKCERRRLVANCDTNSAPFCSSRSVKMVAWDGDAVACSYLLIPMHSKEIFSLPASVCTCLPYLNHAGSPSLARFASTRLVRNQVRVFRVGKLGTFQTSGSLRT